MRKENLYFLTNRMNALSVLSSGLIRSREAFDKKYYEDLLGLLSGRLVLWKSGIPKSVVDATSEMTQIGFPVVFEIETKGISAKKLYCLKKNMKIIETKGSLAAGSMALFPDGVLSLSDIVAVHFRTDDELVNFSSQKMGNLDTEYCNLKVTPELFSVGNADWDSIRIILEGLPAGGLNETRIYSNVDAYTGAVAMVSAAMPSTISWANSLKSLLEKKTSDDCDGESECLTCLHSVIFSKNLSYSRKKDEHWENTIFISAAKKLSRSTHERGLNVLGFAKELFDELVLEDFSPAERDEINKGRAYLIAVLRNETEVKNLEDRGLLCLRALTLFLLRRDPLRILESRHSSINPGENVLVLAAALSGIYCGYARLDKAIKDLAGDQLVYSKFMAEWCNSFSLSGFASSSGRNMAVSIKTKREDSINSRISISVGRIGLKSFIQGPNDVMMVIYQQLKLAGFNLEYSPDSNQFSFVMEYKSGRKQKVFIRTGIENRQGRHTVRFMSPCRNLNSDPLDMESALDLLGRNDLAANLCRFAINKEMNVVMVEVDQLVETADQDELLAHLYHVAKTADEYECELGRDDY